MQNNDDTLHWYEKTALGLAMSAQALVVMQWYLDGNYPADWLRTGLQWLVVIVAVAAGIALDAVVVTTVMGRREGRTGVWGWLTAGSAAVFSALVALHMSGGWSAGAWLHVAYPVTTFLFAQHLSTPHKAALIVAEPCAECATHAQYINDLELELADRMSDLVHASARAEPLAQSNYDLRTNLEKVKADLAQKTAELARLGTERAQPVRLDKRAIVEHAQTLRESVGGWRAVAQAMDIPEATLRKWADDLAHASNGHAKQEVGN